jgi:hydroxymethylpyrimidine pyrophosphatase-like HAD family hydrolase
MDSAGIRFRKFGSVPDLRPSKDKRAKPNIAFNRSRLMVLPQSVSKATCLREALTTLRLSAHNAIGIGDAENDHALLEGMPGGRGRRVG